MTLTMDKIALIDWAWSAKCKNPITKLVLVTLAQEYDETTGSTPATTEHLGALSELGGSTIRKHITKLEKKGLVKKEARSTNSGATAPNEYIFLTHPVPPQSTRVPPRSIPYNNIYIDTSNLDTSNQLQLLDTSNIDTEWVKILKREMKYWPKALTPERTKTWAEDMESMYPVSLLVSESKTCQKWILTSRRKDITKVFSNWMKNASKSSTATTGSSSHSSDDKYAAAAKRQGGH